MRYPMLALTFAMATLFGALPTAQAQISFGANIAIAPGINIGINVPAYPRLQRVPGYPVYYDPRADSNYFFYDGLYWVFQNDDWYSSTWYNGPWSLTDREYVPLFVLRVPVRYYRQPPAYFRGWRADAAPRWDQRWGHEWEQRRPGWDHWDHRNVPRAAPLPSYQRQYSGDRYPHAEEQQHDLRSRNYRYQPREAVTQQHFQDRREQQDRSSNRSDSRGDSQQGHRDQQREQAQPQRQQQAQHPQADQQDKRPDNRGEARGKGNDKKDREDNTNAVRGWDRP